MASRVLEKGREENKSTGHETAKVNIHAERSSFEARREIQASVYDTEESDCRRKGKGSLKGANSGEEAEGTYLVRSSVTLWRDGGGKAWPQGSFGGSCCSHHTYLL